MQFENDRNEEPDPVWRERMGSALPGLLLALNVVLVGVILARPWEPTLHGPVAQVQPAGAAANLPTGPDVGQLAPNFQLQDLAGNVVELAAMRGQPVVLNFWATWCIFCVSEMPALQRLAERFGSEITIIGVNVGQSLSDASAFATNEQITYPLVLDSNGDVTENYRIYAMPSTFVIDRDGVIRVLRYGTLLPPDLLAALEPLLAATPAAP